MSGKRSKMRLDGVGGGGRRGGERDGGHTSERASGRKVRHLSKLLSKSSGLFSRVGELIGLEVTCSERGLF